MKGSLSTIEILQILGIHKSVSLQSNEFGWRRKEEEKSQNVEERKQRRERVPVGNFLNKQAMVGG